MSAADTPANHPEVHGEPGEGRIEVEAAGGNARWDHPGVYWLPKGATLLVLVKLAAVKDLPGGEMPGDTWIFVKRTGRTRGRFLLRRIRPGMAAADFVLEDGDILQTAASL